VPSGDCALVHVNRVRLNGMNAESPVSDLSPEVSPRRTAPSVAERTVALIEVLLCSDYPTQFALNATFLALGFHAQGPNGLNFGFVMALSLADTVFLVGLIVAFLLAHGESPTEVFFGGRPIAPEARAGIPLTFVAFAIALLVLLTVRAVAPWLHTVEHNPLQDLMRTPGNALLFAGLVIVAGGIREELQRAFLLRRFERSLGGANVGLVVASAAFGLGHLVQGVDAVIATALLGAFWGVVYLRRRSVIAPMVSHSGFDLLQVMQFMATGR
jgi:membrane protease YdiL (CAAX protease family)